MNRNYFVLIIALCLVSLFLIFFSIGREINAPMTKEPPAPPPITPFPRSISGTGVVEAKGGNTYIGTPVNRLVEKIFVKVGDKVEKGQPLFRLENRDLSAQLKIQEALLKSAMSKLKRQEALPRVEDLASAGANLTFAQVELEQASSQYKRVLALPDPRSLSEEERSRREFADRQAKAKFEQAKASWEKIKEGTWKPDLELASLAVEEAKAHFHLIQTELDRTTIYSPIDGTVLQMKIREGEFTPLDTRKSPIMILGDISDLYLRVSINQLDIPFFDRKSPAVAFLQSNSQVKVPLEFVRVEPFLVSKQNLTHEITETVDTQVLQVIYLIKKKDENLFVGEEMDVFIKAYSADL